MKGLIFAFVMVFGLMSQDPASQKDEKTSQKASLKAQVDILQIQKKETQLATRFNQCRTEMASIPEGFSKLEKEKQDAVDGAFKEAGLDSKEYDLNVETFEFTKKVVKPAEPEKK